MLDRDKTKKQLIDELMELRKQNTELSTLLAKNGEIIKSSEKKNETLTNDERKYRGLADLLPQSVFEVDAEGNFIFVNSYGLNSTGYTQDDIDNGLKIIQVIAPEHRKRAVENIGMVLSGKNMRGNEYELLKKDGSKYPVIIYSTPVMDGKAPIGLRGIAVDITDQRRAKEALRESESRYRNIIAQAGGVAYECDWEKNVYTFMDEGIEHLTGYTASDITPKLFLNLIEEQISNIAGSMAFRSEVSRRIGGNTATLWQAEYRLQTSDGRTIWVTDSALQFRNSRGGIARSLGMLLDITTSKQTVSELQESEEKFRLLSEQSLLAIVILQDNSIKYFNNAVCNIIEYSAEEIRSWKPGGFAEIFHPEDLHFVMDQALKKQSGETEGLVTQHSFRVITKSGQIRWVEQYSKTIAYDGRPADLATLMDITERRRMEEELLKVEKLESIGILAGGIAHDLNNLLTGVIGNISLAKIYDDLGEKNKSLEEAENASMQIKGLTQQLLTFSKGGTPILQTADIAELLKKSTSFTLRGSNVKCEFAVDDDLWIVEVDSGQINQVVNNLIINAQQAMPEGGIIRISARNAAIGAQSELPLEAGEYIKISVSDEGIGIPEEHRQKIFDPFFSTKQEGSGLGLATSYSIIEKHNGHIALESQLGVGTTFHIYLPASPNQIYVAASQEEQDFMMGTGRILIMDDEKYIRKLATEILAELGYEVTATIDGNAAVETYRAAMESGNSFDALILDLTIPGGMGGREAIQKILEIDPEAKAIVSSGYSNAPILSNYMEYGFRGVVAKPYQAKEMSKIMSKVINNAPIH